MNLITASYMSLEKDIKLHACFNSELRWKLAQRHNLPHKLTEFAKLLELTVEDLTGYLKSHNGAGFYSTRQDTTDAFYIIKLSDGYQSYYQERGGQSGHKLFKTIDEAILYLIGIA